MSIFSNIEHYSESSFPFQYIIYGIPKVKSLFGRF